LGLAPRRDLADLAFGEKVAIAEPVQHRPLEIGRRATKAGDDKAGNAVPPHDRQLFQDALVEAGIAMQFAADRD
jgi:hypothetical protein